MGTLTDSVMNPEPLRVRRDDSREGLSVEEVYVVAEDPRPLLTDHYEGRVFMRGSCGSKPCKGHYQ